MLKNIKTNTIKSLIRKPFDEKKFSRKNLREIKNYRAVVEILSKTSAILTDLLL